jgi:hypothetical protein
VRRRTAVRADLSRRLIFPTEPYHQTLQTTYKRDRPYLSVIFITRRVIRDSLIRRGRTGILWNERCGFDCVKADLRRTLVDLPLNRVLDELASAPQRELFFQMSLIGFYRLYAQVQLVRDLPGAPAFANGAENL